MDIQAIESKLKFDENGLIPVVVQDYATHEVLTLAYMNRESLRISLTEGRTCFYSRSRKCLWRKGETSGNVQKIVAMRVDCDQDALVVEVKKAGPACHTGAESCFFNELYRDEEVKPFSIRELYEIIQNRKTDPKQGSYTSYLFEKGMEKIIKKVGEESTEVIIAAAKGEKTETVYELGDLVYHALVMMAEMGISYEDMITELAKRHVVDFKVKQERMR
ncbi:MAG: bifunctional phosphoribosyl-AMP cyclohydrolase/phosphoribosyl-ATP diphosphatase HisIE [Clostridiales bacterium]|nr:bifunctional phosphoribosyl-AMP cyclohydrolase/phosphoribosyl-ATP diphosphatase HisIE [Clostridiales bacterium]